MDSKSELVIRAKYSLRLLKPYKTALIIGILCGFIALLLAHSIPLILRHLIDVVIPQADTTMLAPTVAVLFAVVIVSAGLTLLYIYMTMLVREKAALKLSARLFGKVQSSSLEHSDKNQTGDVITTIDTDSGRTIDFAMKIIDDIPLNIIVLLYIFTLLVVMDWRLLLLSLLIVPLLILSQIMFGKRIRNESNKLRALFGGYISFLEERINHVKLVQLFNREEDETRLFTRRGQDVMNQSIHIAVLQEGAVAASTFLTHFSLALVLGVSAYFVVQGSITLGTMVAFYGYQVSLYSPIKKMMNTYIGLKQSVVSVNKVMDLEKSSIPLDETQNPEPLPNPPYDFTINNVSLTRGDREIFDNISMVFASGRVIGITGPSGSGKSTVLELAYRFLEPNEGNLKLNGIDIRNFKAKDYRKLVALLPSNTTLVSGTIEENIKYGMPEASKDMVEQAAKFADLHKFIQKLPMKYNTDIGSINEKLSEGQIKRIAIARALLKKPYLYLFDETTSGLDAETESRIQRIWWLLRSSGKIVVVTSHRITSLKNTDYIYVLANGQVAEEGKYNELIRKDSLLRKLARMQD
jgi:ABC-type multidrug transport system fused ATPase/permease subunit